MNVIKHMEAAFIFALSVAGVASVVVDGIPAAQAHTTAMAAANPAAIPVVKVTAKRMSAAEKQQSLADEQRGSRA